MERSRGSVLLACSMIPCLDHRNRCLCGGDHYLEVSHCGLTRADMTSPWQRGRNLRDTGRKIPLKFICRAYSLTPRLNSYSFVFLVVLCPPWQILCSSPGRGKIVLSTSSRPVLGPTQLPIQWIPGAFSRGVKRPGREADYSPPTSAEVKNTWIYTSTPPYVFMA
jgi:hypothetical protein